jgi:DNA-binding response OmpR family regulator
MSTVNHSNHVVERLAQLAGCLNQAVRLADEITADVARNLAGTASCPNSGTWRSAPDAAKDSGGRPIVDRTTFTVRWSDKICYLGNTLPFKLFERLARRPNQLVHCDQLLDEVWQCCRSREAMRSVVKVLRQKLCQAGMKDLAKAIDGKTARHYGLMLNRRL